MSCYGIVVGGDVATLLNNIGDINIDIHNVFAPPKQTLVLIFTFL
jgi:hypothetical protein